MFVEASSSVGRHVLSEGFFEKGVLAALDKVIKDCGATSLMIDIGANIGNHTIALAPHFQRIEAVEPHPVLFRVLEANVLWNKLNSVTCHNIALAGSDGKGTLEEAATEHSISRVKGRSVLPSETFGLRPDQFSNQYDITLRSAHDFVASYSELLPRAFIKIDVEGMEQEIIESIKPLLRAHNPLVGFELFTKAQPNLIDSVRTLPGYDLFAIRMHDVGENKLWRALKLIFKGRVNTVERIDPEKLDAVYPLVLLVPASKAALVDGRPGK